MKHQDLAKEIISKVTRITIASCDSAGQPWNSPVFSAYDEQFNLYWTSDKTNQHSKNIHDNPKVFIVIYDSTGTLGNKSGVYIQAKAEALTDPAQITQARALLMGRKGKPLDGPDGYKNFVGEESRRVYRAVPKKFWVNDAKFKDGDYLKDFRVEITLL